MNSILGLYFSPRAGGNSDLLLDAFLRGASESGARHSAIWVRDFDIQGCLECGECDDTGKCIIDDDMQHLYNRLIKAENVVISSPIFFYGLPSQAKALVDRCQALWNRVRLNPALKRPAGRGFFLGVGATKGQNLFDGTMLTIKYFLDALGLPTKLDSLTFRQIEKKGAIKDHPTALAEAFEAGKKWGNPF